MAKNEQKEQTLQNFSFEHNGETFWYSRSMTSVVYNFAKNAEGEWCVLANKRGPGAPTNRGKWNVPCGYLDHNESILEAACRETHEETGITITTDQLNFYSLNTQPKSKRQNLDTSFYTILAGTIDDYPTTDKYSEPKEVADIQWIPVSKIDNYTWVFNQKPRIKEIYKLYINPPVWRRYLLYMLQSIKKKLGIERMVM